ncbi:fused isobutyryl-CoA mutase/GTPase IcmF [Cryptosporangium phraense]|uniref:fused isobutyryl-CoA mutase/GTPase IcmF n=1 Tax=Cryptosporangium phraense TaxID=2593070 RepID=UPI001F10DEE4|nr:fused isobutyryl-CoA mutase/GTPase IcmF [Cryptosporangium phraense]
MASALHTPVNPVRFVTASSLFDGHDAAINIMRRILQSQGAEVIHLGHNRSVREVVDAAIQEDVQGVAISAYQGGHVEYFTYLVELLQERGAGHIKVFGGGGGVIVPDEIALLHSRGVAHIFSPAEGQKIGLPAMINSLIAACDYDLAAAPPPAHPAAPPPADLASGPPPADPASGPPPADPASGPAPADPASGSAPADPASGPAPVDGGSAGLDGLFTGATLAVARAITMAEAGALPADLADEIRRRAAARRVPVLGITGTGGSGKSSLTDELVRRFRLDQQDKLRIAVLAVDPTRRRGGGALLGDRIRMNGLDGDVVFFRSLATRGAGRELPEGLGDTIAVCRASGFDLVIVETPGIGQGDAAIVPFVDFSLYVMTPEFGAASQLEKIDMLDFADAVAINKFERRGAEDARRDVARQLVRNREAFGAQWADMPVYGTSAATFNDDGVTALYQFLRGELNLSEGTLPTVTGKTSTSAATIVPPTRVRYLADIADGVRQYHGKTDELVAAVRRTEHLEVARAALEAAGAPTADLEKLIAPVDRDAEALLATWEQTKRDYDGDELVTTVRDRTLRTTLRRETLSGTKIPRVALPKDPDRGALLRFLREENLPGRFPFTAGVFPFKRDGEDPARMFAGEGDAFRTNRRFKYLSKDSEATRLSTAFDSVTLYGRDPDTPPDVYGKIGTSGVSIATLDDMKALYDGFDLTSPTTSVSMTINGPAPTILAFFLNTVIDQSDDPAEALRTVRGTVQADILKEDQGQNTCLFSTEFSLKMMADIQEWFIEHEVRNFYSVSISGYHIAEAGANPISQLAFTLANGFTYVESYLARGMDIDDFAPNLSFFFSNGMDAEYTVLGRVARRIWAIAMRDRYGANERSQKLKYHVQTSGRSLHAQEMQFNDIRTTLQALTAIYDNCNSLHTNAYDEAVTTPTEASVRRALAIQLIINREWGLAMNENPLQGSYVVDELTDLVEEAVLAEFDRISERGGVLGAMETGYQRGRIQDESMLYEQRKHDGSLPLIGVNTFLPPDGGDDTGPIELARATEDEKRSQVERVRTFQREHRAEAEEALTRLKNAALADENVFAVLMDAARVCSLGQITAAFFEVGGQYRRNV